MAATASVSSGMPMISVTRVTERDNSNPPCDLSPASEDSRQRQAAKPSHRGPEKRCPRAIVKVAVGLSGGGGHEEEQLTEELSWEDDDHRQVEEAGRRHERAQAAGRERQAGRYQRQDHRAEHPEDREHGTQAQRVTHRAAAAAHGPALCPPEPLPRPTPPSVRGTTTACSTRLISSTPIARKSGRFVSAGVTRYQCPSSMPVVAAPRTAAERATISAMTAAFHGDPAMGQNATAIPTSSISEARSVTNEVALEGPLPRQLTTALTINATTKTACKKTSALAAG